MLGNARVMKCHRQDVGGLRANGFTKVLPLHIERSPRASPVVYAERRKATALMADGGVLAKKIGAAVGHVSLVGVLLLSGGLFFISSLSMTVFHVMSSHTMQMCPMLGWKG
jgi:hypothetical protein